MVPWREGHWVNVALRDRESDTENSIVFRNSKGIKAQWCLFKDGAGRAMLRRWKESFI